MNIIKHNKGVSVISLFLVAIALSLRMPVNAQKSYTITDLTADTCCGATYPAINNAGQIVGALQIPQGSYTEEHAFLWQNGKITDLNTLPDARGSVARAINDRGQIVGYLVGVEGLWHACLWDHGRMIRMDEPLKRGSDANGINNQGEIVGMVLDDSAWKKSGKPPLYTDTGSTYIPFFTYACIWKHGKMTNLGGQGGKEFTLVGINNNGQVIGNWNDSYDNRYPVILTNSRITRLYGSHVGSVLGINNHGQIIGCYDLNRATSTYQQPFLWQNGKVSLLGKVPQDARIDPLVINGKGQVVGSRGTGETILNDLAVLWNGQKWIDLNKLIPADSGWILRRATGINDAGQIVGGGEHNGKRRLFLLTPQ